MAVSNLGDDVRCREGSATRGVARGVLASSLPLCPASPCASPRGMGAIVPQGRRLGLIRAFDCCVTRKHPRLRTPSSSSGFQFASFAGSALRYRRHATVVRSLPPGRSLALYIYDAQSRNTPPTRKGWPHAPKGVGDCLSTMPSLLVARQNPLDNVKNTFSSWDSCMAKVYCKSVVTRKLHFAFNCSHKPGGQ